MAIDEIGQLTREIDVLDVAINSKKSLINQGIILPMNEILELSQNEVNRALKYRDLQILRLQRANANHPAQ